MFSLEFIDIQMLFLLIFLFKNVEEKEKTLKNIKGNKNEKREKTFYIHGLEKQFAE